MTQSDEAAGVKFRLTVPDLRWDCCARNVWQSIEAADITLVLGEPAPTQEGLYAPDER